jgi:O-acetyl-ADP-ribose deacetylase (regulator of RNase III)
MISRKIKDVVFECIQGDISKQNDIDAVVNAANAQLRMGGGVAGALHRGAGPGLEKECRPLAPIQPGQAVITGAHNLPNKHVIHCLGPVYGRDEPSDKLLADCYARALELADRNSLRSVAFPAISSGTFGYPLKEAAHIAVKTCIDSIPALSFVRMVRFVLFRQNDVHVYEQILQTLGSNA